MPLYKYMSFDNLMHVLRGSIRFTQPGAFNDPFEMVPELHVPESFGGRQERPHLILCHCTKKNTQCR